MRYLLFLLFLLPAISVSAQAEEVESLIREGIALHDAGDFDAAIMRYEEALKLDKDNAVIMYEIGYSYMVKGEPKKAAKWMKKVIKAEAEFSNQAYQVLGSVYDDAGKSKKAIEVFKEGIEKYPDDYLLYYNLGLAYARIEDWQNTAETLERGLNADPTHESSLALMASAQEMLGNRVKSLMAAYLFLFLEPDTERAQDVIDLTVRNIIPDVDESGNSTIVINGDTSSRYSAVDIMISMAGVAAINEDPEISPGALFATVNDAFFSVLDTSAEGDIWNDWFAYFFTLLHEDGHTEAFSYYIWQARSDEEVQWLTDNEEALNGFFSWIENL